MDKKSPAPDTKASQERERLRDIGIFTLELIKALVRTGLYSEKHPVTEEAIDNTYKLFTRFKDDLGSLTFFLYESPDKGDDILLEGISDKPVSLKSLLKGAVGEHFVGKFSALFKENRIAALSLGTALTKAQFSEFLNLFVSWKWEKQRKKEQAVEEFSDALLAKGITGITIVGLHEVLGSERHLPWQIRVALTRVKKDLRKVPLLKNASPQQLANLKLSLLAEIIRPIKYPVLILQLLSNIDLAIQDIPYVTQDEVTRYLIAGLPSRHLLDAAVHLMNQLSKGNKGKDQLKGLMKYFLSELSSREFSSAMMFLEKAFKEGYVRFDELPPAVQKSVLRERATKRFLKEPKNVLERLLVTKDPHEKTKLLNMVMLVMPELVQKRDVQNLILVSAVLYKLYTGKVPREFPGLKDRIHDVLEGAAEGDFIERLVEITCRVPKERRKYLEKLVVMYGERVVGPVIKLLTESEEMPVRRAAVDLLIELKEAAVPEVVKELRSHRHPWYTVRNLIHVLGEIGGVEESSVVLEFIDHPHPKVRVECALVLEKLLKHGAEPSLIPLLKDEDPLVRRTALTALAGLNSSRGEVIERLTEVISQWKEFMDNDMHCLVAAVRSLSFYDPVLLPNREMFEELLINIIKPPKGIKAVLPTLLGVKEAPKELKKLIISTLGYIGGEKAKDFLDRLRFSKDQEIAQEAREAYDRLLARTGGL